MESRELFGEEDDGERWCPMGVLMQGECDSVFGETGVCKAEAESKGVYESGGVRFVV